MASSHSNKRPTGNRRLLRFFGAALLTAGIVTIVLLFSKEQSSEAGGGTLGVTISDSTICARMGKNICFVSSGCYDLLDANGQLLVSGALALESPAISACDTLAALYDIGGSTLRLLQSDGTTTDIVPAGDLISVQVSENAYTAVVSEASGYRALVSVYDRDGSEIYQWYASSCWVLSAIVSPDSRQLAVLCLSDGNRDERGEAIPQATERSEALSESEVKIFSLNAQVQNAAFSVSNTILIDLRWMSDSSLCAWSTGQALFFSDDGTWRSTYDFAGKYLCAVAKKGNGFLCFALSPYRNGSTGTLVSLDREGNPLGTTNIDSYILALDAVDNRVLLLSSDSVRLYSSALAERAKLSTGDRCRGAILRSDGRAILIRALFAELVKF